MKKWTFLLVCLLCCSHLMLCIGQAPKRSRLPKGYMKDSFPVLVQQAADLLQAGYMVQTLIAVTDTLPGWEGYPVHLYAYKTGIDARTGKSKKAWVYLLNPSPEKLAMWVATTCWITKKSVSAHYTDQLLDWIRHQSGGQFPVKGLVYEDQYVKGQQEPYLFKDGVTVYMKDVRNWSEHGPFSDRQLRFLIQIENKDLKAQTGQYARICSTTREDYRLSGGKVAVGDKTDRRLSWLAVVRELYKKAWNSDENPLMVMWAMQHLK